MAKERILPPHPDLGPAIARMRAIAAEAGNHLLLGDGPAHPDAALLDLCADIAHQRKVAEDTYRTYLDGFKPLYLRTPADQATHDARQQEHDKASRSFALLLRRASKLRATTAAGIFAKAIVVRSSQTGASKLAMSLAEDLITCPGLRTSLWPADPGEDSIGGG